MASVKLFPGGYAPDNTGTNNAAGTVTDEISPAVQTAGTPKVTQLKLLLSSGTQEHWMFQLQLPPTYTSGGTLRGKFKMASAITGNIEVISGQASTTDLSSNDNSLVFTALDATGAIAVPGTLGQIKEFTLALTTTGMAANRKCIIFVGRRITVSGNATGNMELLSLNLEFS